MLMASDIEYLVVKTRIWISIVKTVVFSIVKTVSFRDSVSQSKIVWHEIRWSPWKVWKSVFQTNGTKELKTQGAECQGPGVTLGHIIIRYWREIVMDSHTSHPGRKHFSLARGCSEDLHYDRPRNLPSNPPELLCICIVRVYTEYYVDSQNSLFCLLRLPVITMITNHCICQYYGML